MQQRMPMSVLHVPWQDLGSSHRAGFRTPAPDALGEHLLPKLRINIQ